MAKRAELSGLHRLPLRFASYAQVSAQPDLMIWGGIASLESVRAVRGRGHNRTPLNRVGTVRCF